MDAVVTTAELLGFVFGDSKKRWEKGLYANGYGFSLKFKLREKEKRKLRPPTESEKADMKRYEHLRGPKYEKVPTGLLLLELDGPLGNASYSVKDGKKVRVEDGLNRFFWFAITEIDRVKKIRAEREKEKQNRERQRVAEEARQAELQRVEQLESSLFREARLWNDCQILRQYILAVESSVDTRQGNEETEDWLNWARSIADKYDPLEATPINNKPR